MKKAYIHIAYALLVITPVISFAAFDGIKTLLRDFKAILDLVIPIVIALALIFFFYGIAQFVRSAGDGQAKTIEEGKKKMLWGVVGLFVMISIYGIIKFLGDSVGIDTGVKSSNTTPTPTPTPTPDGGGDPCQFGPTTC